MEVKYDCLSDVEGRQSKVRVNENARLVRPLRRKLVTSLPDSDAG